jgi:hypothetical protein
VPSIAEDIAQGMRDPAKLQADALDHLAGNSPNQN